MMKIYTPLLLFVIATGCSKGLVAQATAGSLPVILADVSASFTTNQQIKVSWTAQQQVTTDKFIVERSHNGLSWQSIATVKSTGNSAMPVTYSVMDKYPLKGANLYRICFNDINGQVGYTITKNVRATASCGTRLYPNPSTGILTISLGEVPVANWRIALINSSGIVLIQKQYNKNTTTVNLPVEHYLNGNYTLEISDGYFTQVKRLMINHQ